MADHPDDPAADPALRPRPKPRSRWMRTSHAIGGVVAGIDAQVFRTGKPPAELVRAAEPVRGLTGQDGTLLTIEIPETGPAPSAPGPAAPGDDPTALK